MAEHTPLQRIVVMLVFGASDDAVAEVCVRDMRCSGDEARRLILEAKRKITLAADYHRDEQVGIAFMRLNDLYARSVKVDDRRMALNAQKELNRLLRLADAAEDRDPPADSPRQAGPDTAGEIERIKGHLLPLRLADESYPLHEHARLAASLVMAHRGGNPGVKNE